MEHTGKPLIKRDSEKQSNRGLINGKLGGSIQELVENLAID